MGSISDKLTYLNRTKQRFLSAMTGLGYNVEGLTFREAVNLLYAESMRHLADDLDVSTIVDYYQDETKDALAHVLMLGDEYVHHIVLADQHYTYNFMHSAAIVKVLQGTGLFSKVILLGDNADSNDEGFLEALSNDYSDLSGQLAIVHGNHDNGEISRQAFYALLEDDPDFVWQDRDYVVYYYDDQKYKIRYIFTSYSQQYLDWVKDLVNGLPDGWTSVICNHYALYRTLTTATAAEGNIYGGDGTHSTQAPVALAPFLWRQKILRDPTKICMWLHGHTHRDCLTNNLGMWDLSINTDGTKQNNITPTPYRVDGTKTAQCITIVSINPTTHHVVTKKIGFSDAPNYNSISFNYGIVSVPDWVPNYSFNSIGEFFAQNGAFARANPFEFEHEEKRLFVHRKDFGEWSAVMCFYDDSGNTKLRENQSHLKRGASGGYCAFVDFNSNAIATATQCLLAFFPSSSAITDADIQDFLDQFYIGYDVPVFRNWTYDSSNWVIGKKLNTVFSMLDDSEYACSERMIYCEPGQRITLTVNDPNWTTSWLMFYFMATPAETQLSRVGTTTSAASVTVTVPANAHYFLISGQNLAEYTDKVVLTVE